MKKIILIISLLVFLLSGCSTNSSRKINFNPEKILLEAVSVADSSHIIQEITILEEDGRVLQLKLVPPTNDPELIVEQYTSALEKTTELIKRLLPDDPSDPSLQLATETEREKLDEINEEIITPASVFVSSIIVAESKKN